MSNPLLALWLLQPDSNFKPHRGVHELRRLCNYFNVRSINGKAIKYARRAQLLDALRPYVSNLADR